MACRLNDKHSQVRTICPLLLAVPTSTQKEAKMTSRQAKRGKKQRRRLVEAAIPPEVRDATSAEMIKIVEEYFKELLALPVKSYGADELDNRLEFAQRKTRDFLKRGPSVLGDVTVREILAIGLGEDKIEVTFEGDFYKELERVVAAVLTAGIYAFLQAVEAALVDLPDESLAGFSIDETGAETYRSLADQFSGTFDELVEVAQTL